MVWDLKISLFSQKAKSVQTCKISTVCLVMLTLCNPMDYSPPGPLSMGISRQEYWNGLPCSPPGDPHNSGIEPGSSTLWADSLPPEAPGNPRMLEWVTYPFSGGTSQPRNQTGVSCIAGGFFTSWATQEAVLHNSTCVRVHTHTHTHTQSFTDFD